ncbi:MAG: MarR family transcriptional regulator [Minisyncoccota bacterium]
MTQDITSLLCQAYTKLEALGHHFIFQHMDISAPSFKILSLFKDHQPITLSDILNQVGGLKSNLSQRLRTLEAKGFIKRMPKMGSDRRKIFFLITTKGQQKIQEVRKYTSKANLTFEQQFTSDELASQKYFFNKFLLLLTQKEKELNDGIISPLFSNGRIKRNP